MRRFIIEKDFIVNGYRCVIVGNNLGHRCGYIEIPEDHSLHGKHYSVIDDIIDIHGGWTYSNFTNNNYIIFIYSFQYPKGKNCIICLAY